MCAVKQLSPSKNDRLYFEIEALAQIFCVNTRTPFEFAVSDNTFLDVKDKKDSRFNQWFYDILDHWQLVMSEYQGSPFSVESQLMYEKAKIDLYSALCQETQNFFRNLAREMGRFY